jgi:predicted SnoaL-like aldol condensation-catalyzing enzyme
MSMLTLGLALMMTAQDAAPAAPAAPAHKLETHCEGNEANLATYLAMSKILFNERQAERAPEYYAPEVINHNNDGGGFGTSIVKPADMTGLWIFLEKLEPDRKIIDNVIVCKDDLVIAQVTVTGSRAGETLVGKPEGRRRYMISAMDMYRLKDGKVVERWGNADYFSQIRQLGLPVDMSPTPLPPEK